MARKRLPRRNMDTVVETIDPKDYGYSELASTSKQSVVPYDQRYLSARYWPLQRYAEWSFPSSYDSRRGSSPRWFTAYIMSLFSRQAYLNPENNVPLIEGTLGKFSYTHYTNQQNGKVDYQVYSLPGIELIAIPGTQATGELLLLSAVTLSNIEGEPDNFFFYSPFTAYITRLYNDIKRVYGDAIASKQKPYYICGHSRGGALANWIAYRLNQEFGNYTDPAGPVPVCYTYGAAAGWLSIATTDDIFTERHQHYQFMSTFDPVPGLVQAVTYGGAFSRLPGLTIRAPQHYSTYSHMIGGPQEGKSRLAAYAQLFLSSKLRQDLPAVQQMITAHKVSNYCRILRQLCIDYEDTPISVFDAASKWHDSLDGLKVEEADLTEG